MKVMIKESKVNRSSNVLLDEQSRKKQEKTVNFLSMVRPTFLCEPGFSPQL